MGSDEDVIFYGAPLLILIVSEEDRWNETDCALAAQNMMLRAYDLGLGSCFIGFSEDREILSGVGVEASQELNCALIFGYPAEWPEPKEREAQVQRTIR